MAPPRKNISSQGSSSYDTNALQVFNAVWVSISLLAPIVRDPLWFVLETIKSSTLATEEGIQTYLEQTKGFDAVGFVQGESVVNPSREDDEISGFNSQTNPVVGRCL